MNPFLKTEAQKKPFHHADSKKGPALLGLSQAQFDELDEDERLEQLADMLYQAGEIARDTAQVFWAELKELRQDHEVADAATALIEAAKLVARAR